MTILLLVAALAQQTPPTETGPGGGGEGQAPPPPAAIPAPPSTWLGDPVAGSALGSECEAGSDAVETAFIPVGEVKWLDGYPGGIERILGTSNGKSYTRTHVPYDEGGCDPCTLQSQPYDGRSDNVKEGVFGPTTSFAADAFYENPSQAWLSERADLEFPSGVRHVEPCRIDAYSDGTIVEHPCRIGLTTMIAYVVRARLLRKHVLHVSQVDPEDAQWEACGGCGGNVQMAYMYSGPHYHSMTKPGDPPQGAGWYPRKPTIADLCEED